MMTKRELSTWVLVAVVAVSVSGQNIVDFSYSQFTHNRAMTAADASKISVHPDKHILQDYTFPESCYSAQLLAHSALEPGDSLEQSND